MAFSSVGLFFLAILGVYQFQCQQLYNGFFDAADVKCTAIFREDKSVFDSWFNGSLIIKQTDDQLVNDYIKCWMEKKGLTNSFGNINWNNTKNWLTTDVYNYFGKNDFQKYDADSRNALVDKSVDECKNSLGIDNKINNKEVLLYNCLIEFVANI